VLDQLSADFCSITVLNFSHRKFDLPSQMEGDPIRRFSRSQARRFDR